MNPSLGSWGRRPENEVLGVFRMKNIVVKAFAASFALLSAAGMAQDADKQARHDARKACRQAVQAKCNGAADGHACRQQARKEEAGCEAIREIRDARKAERQQFHDGQHQLQDQHQQAKHQLNEEYKAKRQDARKQFHAK